MNKRYGDSGDYKRKDNKYARPEKKDRDRRHADELPARRTREEKVGERPVEREKKKLNHSDREKYSSEKRFGKEDKKHRFDPARETVKKEVAKKDWEKEDRKSREASDDSQLVLKGRHEVVQALESGQVIDSVVISTAVKGPVGKIVRELAGKSQIPVKEMNPDLFERKFGEKSQGIVAIAGAFSYCSIEDIIAIANQKNSLLVALNHVEDARNLGAIVRTVEASGASGIIIPKHRSAGMTEWAIRTAQGAAAYLPVARVNNIGDAVEQLKEAGYWAVGLDGDAEKRYDDVVYSGKIVLVAGGEDAGLGERVRKVCDDVVAIPLCGKTPSLNVSVSTAVVLYEIIRQKGFFKNI
jgi:23S rRNA (guanosine2251-2'-O)-methyltransferase